MTNQTIFEQIKHLNDIGQEYWSARELFSVLDYIKWDKFLNVIDKAKQACENSNQEPSDHFPRMEKLVNIGSGAKRDIHLSRYACYLIVQNADPLDNDNLLKTLETFLDSFPKEVCIFDKIIQNRIVQNGQLRRNFKKTTGREGIATSDSCGISRHRPSYFKQSRAWTT